MSNDTLHHYENIAAIEPHKLHKFHRVAAFHQNCAKIEPKLHVKYAKTYSTNRRRNDSILQPKFQFICGFSVLLDNR